MSTPFTLHDPDLVSKVEDQGTREQIQAARLVMAAAWNSAMQKAMSAALSYGIDYLKLPEYRDHDHAAQCKGLPPHRQVDLTVEWCRRIEHGITAAIQRKTLKQIPMDLLVRADDLPEPEDQESTEEALLREAREAAAKDRRSSFKVVT